MDIRIIKSFGMHDSLHPFHPGQCLTLPDAKAHEWIAEGKAVPLNPVVAVSTPSRPTKRKREKAKRF